MAGLEQPDAGRIVIQGKDVAALPPERRDVGFVFQQFALFPNMSVAANVEYGLKRQRVPTAERARRVEEMLAMVGLGDLAHRRPDQLSAGQQQRVALARALAPRPKTLLLDEPLSALDAAIRVRLREELRETQRRLGITTILVTHDQEEALAIADRVAVMNEGRFEQVGTPWELYDRPRTGLWRASSAGATFWPGRVDGRRHRLRAVRPGRRKRRCPAARAGPTALCGSWCGPRRWRLRLPGRSGGPAAARRFRRFGRRPSRRAGRARAVIADVIFGGERSLVKLAVGGEEWTAAVFGAAAQQVAPFVGSEATMFILVRAARAAAAGREQISLGLDGPRRRPSADGQRRSGHPFKRRRSIRPGAC